MAELQHLEKTIQAASDAVVEDSIKYVKAHPNYEHIVAALGEKALEALAAGL